jgi:hypothetical protein
MASPSSLVVAFFRHHAAGCLVAFTTPLEVTEAKTKAKLCRDRFQNAQPLRDNFLPNPIPWNDCDSVGLHDVSGLCLLYLPD